MIVRTVTAMSALCLASAATAGVTGTMNFVEVDNSGITDGSLFFRTFDMYWENTSGSSVGVTSVNMGNAANPGANPYGLTIIGGAVFNHGFGSDVAPNPAFFGAFPALEFDTYVGFGDQQVTLVPGSMDLTGNNSGAILGSWSGTETATVPNLDDLFLLRLTIRNDTVNVLGSVRLNFDDGSFGVYVIPAPSAAAMLAFGLSTAGRRRR